ncbi:MAG: hypothetical protein H0W33_02290 [Gammaproteobacteria bacterium]|nr:hypothetical protein [Gammaproteobacteria bacterium]
MKRTCLFLAGFLSLGAANAQEDPKESCDGILELYAEGDVDGALEEARWCVESLEQIKQGEVGDVFAAEVDGWKRESLDQNEAMGIAVTEASYKKGEQAISVSLMGGAGGGGMGFLGGLAEMGMMSAGNKMRIDKRTAVANSEGNTSTVTVSLESGGALTFQSYDADLDTVVEFAKAFPIAELDDARG